MKPLWNEIRPILSHVAAFSFFINLLFLVPSIFMLQVFDRVIPSNSEETLIVLLGGSVVALLILLLLDYVRIRLQNVLGLLIEERLSPPVMNAVVEQLSRAKAGGRIDGIRDISSLRAAFSSNGVSALFDAPWAPVFVAVIWAFHPALGMGAALCATIMLVLAWLNDRMGRAELKRMQQEASGTAHFAETSLRNAEVLQALGMTGNLVARWRHLHNRVMSLQQATSKTSSFFSASTRVFRQGIQIIMMSLGAYLVLKQEASPGIMIATTILLGKAVQPIEQLVSSWRTLSDARDAYRRLCELSKDFPGHEKPFEMPVPNGRLSAEGVSFRAPGSDKPILANISFTLAAGETLAILGPSAAGKSTLARVLTGIWKPHTGTVRLDGADVATWDRKNLSPWIGYVPQDVELFEGTVADNIARLGDIDAEKVVAAAQRANAHEMILALPQGYETPVGDHGLRLSPGQRQRIALARALYGEPRYVVLDEPNSNLDGNGEIALAQAIISLREQSVTTVVITHRPSLIAHVDKILVLDAGRVQQFGPAPEIMKWMQKQSQKALSEKVA